MKKALVALAIAGVVAPVAHADNVVIYGRLNTAYQYSESKVGGVKTTDSTLTNQSSRFGFKGEEKIGDLTAEFQIENGFDSTAGGDTLASRDTFVGLKGDFGGIRLGKNETPTWKLFDQTVSKFHHAGAADITNNYNSLSKVGLLGARFSKSALYTSSDLNGFKVGLQFADAQTASNILVPGATVGYTGGKTVDASVVYAAGPVTAGVSLRSAKGKWTGQANEKTDNIVVVAGKYKVDQFDVSLAYENDNFKSLDMKRKAAYYASGQFNVTPNAAVVASLAYAGKTKTGGVTDVDSSAIQYTLGGQYDLSKRTQVYGYYTGLNNKKNAGYGLSTGAVADDTDNKAVVLGVRHNF